VLTSDTLLQQRYRIAQCIGRGGMGAVYEAHDLRLGITVAVKQLVNSSDRLLQAFEREARTLAALHHQALPHVSDYFEEQGSYFLVMAYIPGPDLESLLSRRTTPFPVADVLRWADQLFDVLAYLHSREPPVLHRDIKPQNLKLTAAGDLVLLDFGLARGAPLPGASLIGYTLSYAPPEQIRGEGTDPRGDLYAAGATLYHLLTRQRPPDAVRRQAALADRQPDLLRPVEAHNPQVPPTLAALLASMLALDARARPTSAADARHALHNTNLPTNPQAPTVASDVLLLPTEVAPPAEPSAADLARPSGTVTLLFTDIAGSTRLWERFPSEMPDAITRHNELLLAACEQHHGFVFKNTGDGMCAAFADPSDALAAAIAGQRALAAERVGAVSSLAVRMALHTGAVHSRKNDYLGQPLNRTARLMDAGHGGQVLLSRATQELVRDALPADVTLRDMGEHRLRDLSSPEQIFQVVAPGLATEFPPLRTLNTRITNLPVQPTTLVGREEEVARLRALLLRADVRLATLTGPGGTGKTRLALQVAADLLDEFADGVFFVDLAATRTTELVLAAVARALGLREQGDQPPLALLKEYLAGRQVLLVLDNFEQVVVAAPLVAEVAAAAPRVKALVTSREALHLAGEHEFAVAPLATPDLRRLRGRKEDVVATVAQWSAVALFVARAQAARNDFVLTPENAAPVAEICVRLDGLPLAIELAAARVKLFAPQALLSRLDQRLKLLTGGPRNTALRQQTLRAAIDWSYELLEPAERELFARLGIFVGGCSFEAAEQLCPSDECDLDILSGLDALVNKSLLRQVETAEGEPRFVMLETIREYALERLAQSGSSEELRERHAAFYLTLAEAAEPELSGPDQATWLDRLDDDHDNLRAVLRWFLERGQGDELARLVAALRVFWHTRSYMSEGGDWLQRALGASVGSSPVRARLLNGAGFWAWAQGRYSHAAHMFEEALACARETADRAGEADALNHLGLIAKAQGQLERAVSYYEESRQTYLALGDRRRAALALNNLGVVAEETGEYALAQQRYEENLRTYRAFGDEFGIADTQINLGFVVLYLGELSRAEQLFGDGARIHRRLGDLSGVAYALMGLGQVGLARRDWQEGVRQAIAALSLFAERDDREGEARSLAVLAEIAAAQGHSATAAQVWGAVVARYAAIDCALTQREQQAYERDRTTAQRELGEAQTVELEQRGSLLTNDQIAALLVG
jgi:predicted ATPase/class 3 adenylate cyclase